MSRLLIKPLLRWAENLRHPTLFWIMAAIFLLDVVTIDFVPFADEILLGLGTILLAKWKNGDKPAPPAPRR